MQIPSLLFGGIWVDYHLARGSSQLSNPEEPCKNQQRHRFYLDILT